MGGKLGPGPHPADSRRRPSPPCTPGDKRARQRASGRGEGWERPVQGPVSPYRSGTPRGPLWRNQPEVRPRAGRPRASRSRAGRKFEHRRFPAGCQNGSARPGQVFRLASPWPTGPGGLLGIAGLEVKLGQGAAGEAAAANYTRPALMEPSHGFRPGRGGHKALGRPRMDTTTRKADWTVDGDDPVVLWFHPPQPAHPSA
jgi:hypothetical protein